MWPLSLFVVQNLFIKPSVVLWSNCYLYTCIFEFAYGRGQVQYYFIVSPSWTSLKERSLIRKTNK